jgi:hypothetical protein
VRIMVVSMENFFLDEADVKAQVQKICAHKKLFAKTANLQEFLEFLVNRRLGGDDDLDNYTGKELAFRFFERDTTIAKVEGNKLRKRLQEYYDTDGLNDPIVIQIPPGPYCPEIVANPRLAPKLSTDALEMLWAARQLAGSLDTTLQADQILDKALSLYPLHPQILGHRARFYADSAFFEDFTGRRVILKAAQDLIARAKSRGPVPWEMLYAEGALEALLNWNWGAADRAFRRAMALNPSVVSGTAWYNAFLSSQLRFEEAHEVVAREMEVARECGRVPDGDLFQRVAAIKCFEGKAAEGGAQLLERWKFFYPSSGPDALSIFAEAADEVQLALDYINYQIAHSEVTRARLAWVALCAGRLGRKEEAEKAYEQILIADANVKIEEGQGPYRSSFLLALASIGIGQPDAAVDFLVKAAVEDRLPISIAFGYFPALRHICQHPRYRSLVLEDMKLKMGPALARGVSE